MSEQSFEGAQPPIDGYAPGGFRVAGVFHEGSLLIAPQGLAFWSATAAGAIPEPAQAQLISALGPEGAPDVDVVLFGAGAELAAPDPSLRARLEALGVGLEPMSTASACRTYNVLLSEGRRVAAALISLAP